jgi:hypothetical protein
MSCGVGSQTPPLSSDPDELPSLPSLLDPLVVEPSSVPLDVGELLEDPSDAEALLDPTPVELVLDDASPDEPSPLSPPSPSPPSAVQASSAVAPTKNSRRPE